MKINSAQLYLCTDGRNGVAEFAEFVEAAFIGGVDIIQLRDKNLEAAEELDLLAALSEIAHRHGKLWAVNDRADIALLAQAPILHLGQKDLSHADAHKIVGDKTDLGLSTHTLGQIDSAIASNDLNYFCVGPVWATPTKPGRAAVGLELVKYAANSVSEVASSKPWFAIGGIDLTNVDQVVDDGASRIVVVRAITEAKDPANTANQLRSALPTISE
jgi:thiamine-phosphate pyrophosphorylase